MKTRFSHIWGEIVRFTPVALFLVVLTFVASQAYLSEMSANLLSTTHTQAATPHEIESHSIPENAPTASVSSQESGEVIGADQALQIALSFIHVSVEDAERTKVTFDASSNSYSVKVTTAKMHADVVVDASNGTVLSLNKELE